MNGDFSIRPPSGYELSNILVNDQPVSGVLGDVLDNGRYHSQSDWVERLDVLNQGRGDRLSLLTGEEYMGVMRTLFEHRNVSELSAAVESLRQVLKHDFDQYWMMTGSRLFIPAEGEDFVVHGLDRENPRKVFGNLTGEDGYLCDHDDEFTRVVLGATVDEVKEIYGGWINEREPYAWRLPRKPREGVAEKPLLLGRDGVSDVAIVSTDCDNGCAARGWAPKISTGNEGS